MVWGSPVKTDSKQRPVDFSIVSKWMGRAVAQSGMAAVKVKVNVEVPGDFQAGF